MKKIPTLFEREYKDHKVVGIKDILTSLDLQRVLDGKMVRPTVKFDGSCCAVIDSKWYKRYDAKKGKKAPEGAIPCQDSPDPVTGHWPHWVKLDPDKAEDKWFIDAFKNYARVHALNNKIHLPENELLNYRLLDGTYEAIGPHFQGNPYDLEKDTLVKHGAEIIEELSGKKLTFEILRDYLQQHNIEGIVFWTTGYLENNYPICKIKRSDFGFEWPIKDALRSYRMKYSDVVDIPTIVDDTIIEKYIIPKKDIDLYLKCKTGVEDARSNNTRQSAGKL